MEAAHRELLEETGFAATVLSHAGRFVSSAGLTDEAIDFYLAKRVQRETDGGGVGNERMTVHTVPLSHVHTWLTERMRRGMQVDSKVLTGLSLLQVDSHED